MNKNFRAEYEKQLSYFIDQRKDLKKNRSDFEPL